MLNMKNIVVPVDFSDRMEGAAHLAKVFACRYQSKVTILHVVPPLSYGAGSIELVGSPAGAWVTEHREAMKNNLAALWTNEFGSLNIDRVLRDGDPAKQIVSFAHDEKVDLIVMPTHGYGPFRRFILGSVTAKILHDADCPVLTGTHMEEVPPAEAIDIKSIVCALDLGSHSEAVLNWAARVSEDFRAKLTIVHALPPLESGEARYFDPTWRASLMQQANDRIAELQQKCNTNSEVFIESGDVAPLVDEAAKSYAADLIVIGRSMDTNLIGRLRANAYSIIRDAPCPVASI